MSQSYWNRKPNSQTTKVIFSPTLTQGHQPLTTDKEQEISLIQAINQQNITYYQQIDQISKQLQKLASLTSSLLGQNQRLRSHYYQRSIDVQNLVGTIRINLSNQLNDVNNQIHLLRQGNCLIFKNIQQQIFNTQIHQDRISVLDSQLKTLRQQNSNLQLNILKKQQARLKKKLNEEQVRKLTRQVQKLTECEEKLLQKNEKLLLQFSSLQKNNIRSIKETTHKNYQNDVDKHQFKDKIVRTLKSLVQLKSDKVELQDYYSKATVSLSSQMGKQQLLNKTMEQKLIEKQEKIEKLRLKMYEKQNRINEVNKQRKQIQETQNKQAEKQQQAKKMAKQVQQKQKNISNLNSQFQNQKMKLKKSHEQRMNKIKLEIQKIQGEKLQQKGHLQQQLKKLNETRQSCQKQYEQLSKQLKDYQSICVKFDKYVGQIQKAQTLINLKDRKNASGTNLYRQPLNKITNNI